MQILQHPIARVCACVVAFFVCFVLNALYLSHYLFFWDSFAYSSASSKTMLWGLYAAFAVVAGIVLLFLRPSFFESVLLGLFCALSAGGAYCIGYTSPVIVGIIAIVLFLGVLLVSRFLRADGEIVNAVLRAVYVCLGLSFAFSLVSFLISAENVKDVKNLTNSATYSSAQSSSSASSATSSSSNQSLAGVSSSGSSSTSSNSNNTSTPQVSNAEWAVMSTSQREIFLANVVAAEAEHLNLGEVTAITCILPEDVPATTDKRGRVLINFAAVRVKSPEPATVADFEATNGVSWTYEELTSPRDIVIAVCHALGHVYEQKRVSGELSEQKTWPYEDASDADGNNSVLDSWSEELPVSVRTDNGYTTKSSSNLLERQAWGYAYTRVSAYIKS